MSRVVSNTRRAHDRGEAVPDYTRRESSPRRRELSGNEPLVTRHQPPVTNSVRFASLNIARLTSSRTPKASTVPI